MNDVWTNIATRGSHRPAGSGVRVLYGLPSQQVGAAGSPELSGQVATVKDALDLVSKIPDELSVPVHEPESLKPGIMPYPGGRMPLPGGTREAFVMPGRPFPRFRYPYGGR